MMNKKILASSGFTLVEIMISLVLSSFVIAGVYGVYSIQQRSYKTQGQVADLQQQLRSALDFITRDIRMVGYNPGGVCSVNPTTYGILNMGVDNFSFEYCGLEDNTWKLHTVTYSLEGSRLMRNLQVQDSPGQQQAVAEGIDAIEFRYLQGNSPPGHPELPPPEADLAKDTRIIQLSILIRSLYPDPYYKDTITYLPASGKAWTRTSGSGNPPNDNYQRRLLVTSIELRNVGL
ncbi:prepilin-type N-terminal cleavage/methylation domain-containing protein [Candidatus Electronema sp. JM]|uniref:prepilin-type N-terminal cleavage/methylation domain-containing protein n=1 Tax=Candidatus Electronema sp. JM TaxID=3401571 RepID=UPI003AA9C261